MAIATLDHYGISRAHGFLCPYNAGDVALPEPWTEAAQAAMQLPQWLPTGEVRRHLLAAIPDHSIMDVEGLSDPQARMAMVHYSFMVQAWVWGEQTPSGRLPAALAIPMVALADRLGQQPLLPYSGYVLDNWTLIDPDAPVSLDNIAMIQNFLSGQDEAWFVLIHVAIEARAGEALALMKPIVDAIGDDDIQTATRHLESMAGVWRDINQIFDRMPERCDPYVYFRRVRPYIHGWKDNPGLPDGVVYEGVERYDGQGQVFRGQTGSQSSIVPSMDALLGIGHAGDPLRTYLDELHHYRPPGHRWFIEDVRASSRLREFTQTSGDVALINAYNANVQGVADFRARHLEYAATYINKQGKTAEGNHTDVGTGGTPFMRYLKKHRNETRANLLVA
ncbi:MAG: indoleamine 2,3-dioxygenase [Pseudomonadota bacterium]